MKIERFVLGIVGTNTYLIINEETKQTVLVDPADCPKKLTDHIAGEGLKIEAVLLTHGHYDHIRFLYEERKSSGKFCTTDLNIRYRCCFPCRSYDYPSSIRIFRW